MMKKIISLVLVAALAMSMMVMAVSAANGDDKDYYTRGEWAVMIAEKAGADLDAYVIKDANVLKDMAGKTDKVAKAVAWGVENKIIKGYCDGNYKPDQAVEFEEAVAIAARAIKEELLPAVPVSNETEAPDVEFAGVFAEELKIAVQYGLVCVTDDIEGETKIEKNTDANAADALQAVLAIASGEDTTVAEQANVKFQLAVLSGENADEGYVKATVYETYAMVIEIGKAKVDAGYVTLEAMMNNVASLGGGVKSHKISVETGLEGDPELKTWLSNCFAFKGATIKINVDGKDCVYNVKPVVETDDCATIAFVPESTEATRAAWQALTANVKVTTQDTDDSYIFIDEASELVIGEETLVFENSSTGLKLDNFSNIDALKQAIRDNVKMGEKATDNKNVQIVVGKDTQLAVGQTIATLNKTCTIAVNGINMSESSILSDLRAAESTYAMAEKLVKMINELVGAVNDKTVEVAVSFAAQ